ncbi:MAG: FadR/GntR family transcriptional regulator [Caproiciproducens sp.]
MDKVSNKQWKPGTKIPTEFELMETLDVSRNTVREAIKVLEALGLLEIRRADGTYVVNHFSEKMMTPWACSLLLEDDDSRALLELRMQIERGIFSLAIQKGSQEDMKAIHEAFENFVRRAEDEKATSSDILYADIKYRDKICEASHNHLMTRLNDMITYASMNSRRRSIEDAIACNDRFHMVDSHRKLTETIVQRRTADLDSVLDYCYKYWGITLQNEE